MMHQETNLQIFFNAIKDKNSWKFLEKALLDKKKIVFNLNLKSGATRKIKVKRLLKLIAPF